MGRMAYVALVAAFAVFPLDSPGPVRERDVGQALDEAAQFAQSSIVVAPHGGKRFAVPLGDLRLTIGDDGVGFSPQTGGRNGLGLMSTWIAWRRRRPRHDPLHSGRRTRLEVTAPVARIDRSSGRMIAPAEMTPRVRRALLYSILVFSIAVRLVLVEAGGQAYWWDTAKFQGFSDAASEGRWHDALLTLQDRGDHFVFAFAWVMPDVIAYVLHEWNLTDKGDAEDGTAQVFFGMVSVVSIWLLWRIMRQAGASDEASLTAAALLAASSTFFYYARHWLPYDFAMMLALLALVAGIRPSPRIAHSVACGFLAACAFMMYLGYWTVAGAVVLLHATYAPASWRDVVRRLAAAGAGAIVFMATIFWLFSAINGRSLFEYFTNHAARINQGSFSEGWSLPFAYFWHAEHGVLLLWLVALGSCVWRLRQRQISSLEKASLLAVVVIYGALVVTSVVLERFVVYGRLARQLVPFFCVITAYELVRLRRLPWMRSGGMMAAAALLAVQVAVNFRAPLVQSFPIEFRETFGRLAKDLPPYEPNLPVPSVLWVNAERFYPTPPVVQLPPRYTVLAEARHPLQFLPYQYEGSDPGQREVLRAADLRMRLLAVDPNQAQAGTFARPVEGGIR